MNFDFRGKLFLKWEKPVSRSAQSQSWLCPFKITTTATAAGASLRKRLKASAISTKHIATLLGATCCVRLATLLRYVATCWVLLAQIWNWSNFSCSICRFAWCCSRLARMHLDMRTSSIFNTQHVVTTWPNACNMLCWNAVIIWLEFSNAGPTMLWYVVLICCDRLAGAQCTEQWFCTCVITLCTFLCLPLQNNNVEWLILRCLKNVNYDG